MDGLFLLANSASIHRGEGGDEQRPSPWIKTRLVSDMVNAVWIIKSSTKAVGFGNKRAHEDFFEEHRRTETE